MTSVEVPEETLAKVRMFSKVIDAVLDETLGTPTELLAAVQGKGKESDANYVAMILEIGMERMIQDPLPNDEPLKETVTDMFRRNPSFVSEYVAQRLKEGAEIETTKAKQSWKSYIT